MSEVTFYSPDGSDVRVTLPSGGAVIVGPEPRTLPPEFHRAALREGCVSSDVEAATEKHVPTVKDATFKRREIIRAKIEEALEAEEGAAGFEEAFTNAGLPHLAWLDSTLGFKVERSERDEIWKEMASEVDSDA